MTSRRHRIMEGNLLVGTLPEFIEALQQIAEYLDEEGVDRSTVNTIDSAGVGQLRVRLHRNVLTDNSVVYDVEVS